MYVPPSVLRLQKIMGSSNPNDFKDTSKYKNDFSQDQSQSQSQSYNSKSINLNTERKVKNINIDLVDKNEEVILEQKKTLKDILEEYNSDRINRKTITIEKTVEEKEDEVNLENESSTEFWYDIYNLENYDLYTNKEQKINRLFSNNKLTKEAMVKLLHEQGIIKFNPIEYYKNTIDLLENSKLEILDKLNYDIFSFILEEVKSKTIHSITQNILNEIYLGIEKIIEESRIEQDEKKSMKEEIKAELEELIKKKPQNLVIKYGFKYYQYRDFLEKFYKSCNDKKVIKALINEKDKKSILNKEKVNFNYLEKFLKKECKTLSFINNKYLIKYLELQIISYLFKEEVNTLNPKKDKDLLKEFNIILENSEKNLNKLKELIDNLIKPYHSKVIAENIVSFEKDLDLYEYTNLKDKIICEKEREILERNQNIDEKTLIAIRNYDYSKASTLDLSRLINSVIIQENRIPYMIELLNYYSSEVLPEKPDENFLKYIETYLYISSYLDNHTKDNETLSDKERNTLKRYDDIKNKLNKYLTKYKKDLYEIQMKEMYEILEPLSKFDENLPKLDDWQKKVFEMIDKKRNVIVIAPTSSGKTVLSTYCSIISNKLLFVVPSAELARQVCGMIRNLILLYKLKKNIMLVTEKDIYSDTNNFDILVGTPCALERYFIEKDIAIDIFDYVVFDEIHQLNHEVLGVELERFVKLATSSDKTKFLALSACVSNAEQLKNWWSQYSKDIELIVCNRRFLQQQKYLWDSSDNKLNKINPLSVCSLEFLQNNGFIDNEVVKVEMSMTPDDLYDIYKELSIYTGFNRDLHPKIFFNKTRLSLEDCKNWELSIKKYLQELSRENPEFIQKILDKYQNITMNEFKNGERTIEDLYKLLKTLQKENMLPTILFRLDENVCQMKFIELLEYMKQTELFTYPSYYDDLKIKNEAYLEMLKKLEELKNIPLPDFKKLEEMNLTPEIYLEERKNTIKENELSNLVKRFTLMMDNNIQLTKDLYKLEKDILLKEVYEKRIKYYNNEKETISNLEELRPVNIYKPHPEFSFLDSYITSEHIIEFRKQLMEYISEESKSKSRDNNETRKESYVSYDHPFISGVERGMILYLNRLPTAFQRVAQSLISSPLKLAPVTFSDKSLAFGINYPIRSVILTGGYINPIIAHQMIGRAGRRGIDPKGYTIYYDVDWKTINKEKYLEVSGSNFIDKTSWIIPEIWTNIENIFDITYKYHLKDFTSHSIDLESSYDEFIEEIEEIKEKFREEYVNELIIEELFNKIKLDIYRNKNFGIQSVLIPFLIEELSRWKFKYNTLETTDKNKIILLLIRFLNGNLQDTIFSTKFKNKAKQWNLPIIIKDFKEITIDGPIDETNLNTWIILLEIIGSLFDLIKKDEKRIRVILKTLYESIKNKTKKVMF